MEASNGWNGGAEMSSDIVERLREPMLLRAQLCDLADEAADEIERLRALLGKNDQECGAGAAVLDASRTAAPARLWPCPFCGSEYNSLSKDEAGNKWAWCNACDASAYASEWNRRAFPAPSAWRLRDALQDIALSHLGDCPAALPEIDHAKHHIMHLRKIARAALIEVEPVTEEEIMESDK